MDADLKQFERRWSSTEEVAEDLLAMSKMQIYKALNHQEPAFAIWRLLTHRIPDQQRQVRERNLLRTCFKSVASGSSATTARMQEVEHQQ
ncbi:MAG: hypothetical protein ACXWT4_15400 [Methylobacter sp.]